MIDTIIARCYLRNVSLLVELVDMAVAATGKVTSVIKITHRNPWLAMRVVGANEVVAVGEVVGVIVPTVVADLFGAER